MDGLNLNWDFVAIPELSETGVKDLTFDGLLPRPLKVEQDGGAVGCGGKLWPAGELLSRYMIRKPDLPYRKILELGSGTGLAGLAVALGHPDARDTEIIITDQDVLLPLMEANVRINTLSNRVNARTLDWGEPLPDFCDGVDLILAADCVYSEAAFPLLKATLLMLTEEGDVPILMAYKKRRKADRHFFRTMKNDFTITEISDFPEFKTFYRESVYLFSMRRIRRNALE